ncbi:MAG: hypothetical protein WAO00_14760, partial [Chthoniobacterales bacterium]
MKVGIITDHNGLPLPCAIGSTLGPLKPSVFNESIRFPIPREEILINHQPSCRGVAASLGRGVTWVRLEHLSLDQLALRSAATAMVT